MNRQKLLSRLDSRFFEGIAHRGLWNEECTENGPQAFARAIAAGMAFEYDIHLTKDGQLLVCHDDSLKRTTGKEGIIEELTLETIQRDYRLNDGEKILSFPELLALNHEQVPMVVELKVHAKNYKPLAQAASKALQQIQDPRKVWVISFDPRALICLKKDPFVRALLICKEKAWVWHLRGFFESVDLEDTLVNEPKVQRYRKKHLVNTWTIERPDQLEKVLPYVDTVTFQRLLFGDVRAALKNKTK